MASLARRLTTRPSVSNHIPSPGITRPPQTCRWRPTHISSGTLGHRHTHSRATEFLQNNDRDLSDSQRTVREAISKICSAYPDEYWLRLEETKTFPADFHAALADAGWLGICMPAEYGGSELGIAEAAIMMQTIAECGGGMGAASSVHMNIFGLEPVVKFGSEEQKKRWLAPLIQGKERACFGVTEPNTGLDTLRLQSQARKSSAGDHYILSGQKIWISTAQNAHKILILVRTTPLEQVQKPSQGLSLFYTDLDRSAVEITEIPKMGRAAVDTNTLFFDNWRVPATDLIGAENDGFKLILHGMNAERILIAAEALGLGYAALRRASIYARDRHVFGRAIGQNQAVQHPLAISWMELEAARMMVYHAARMYDGGYAGGEYANSAKYLAAEAAFRACERAVMVHGGMGYAKEYHVERYLREAFIPRIAPVSREMICNYIGERVLGLPRSY
ncbi:acyl-CoA dehydrogenase/oxidase [Aspergillus carlsbadensis]|nr:acyl-CoA dehydrogenase/oxidase [Aspergillus carlsbadensis]